MARVYNSRGRGNSFWNFTAGFFFVAMIVLFLGKLLTLTGLMMFSFPGWFVGVAFFLAVAAHMKASTFYPYTVDEHERKTYQLPSWLENIDDGRIMLPMMVASIVLLFY